MHIVIYKHVCYLCVSYSPQKAITYSNTYAINLPEQNEHFRSWI